LIVQIRRATLADAPVLAATVHEGFESFRAWAPGGWDPPPPQVDLVRIRAAVELPGTWCVLAEDGGDPAGHVAFTPARTREAARRVAHLWMLFVRRPWWGTGLAADLLGRAVAEAASRGYEAMRLETPARHARARAFYEREGWRTEGAPEYLPLLGLEVVEYRRDIPVSGN
jgi:GNAT superfamily N-acetyltransferase